MSREPLVILRHDGEVHGVAFDRSGLTIVTVGADPAVRIWNVSIGAELTRFEVATTCMSVAFHPEGHRIAVGDSDGSVVVYDVLSRRRLWHAGRGVPATSVLFDPSGQRVVSASSRSSGATVWDGETGAQLQSLSRPWAGTGGVAFDPAGGVLATGGSDGSLLFWTGEPLAEIARYDLAERQAITCVAGSPDGRQLACGLSNGSVRLRAMSGGAGEERVAMAHGIQDVAYSPVPGLLATCAGDTVQLWNLNNTVQLWNLNSGRAVLDFQHDGKVNALAFAPVGNVLASASSDGTVRLTSLLGTVDP